MRSSDSSKRALAWRNAMKNVVIPSEMGLLQKQAQPRVMDIMAA